MRFENNSGGRGRKAAPVDDGAANDDGDFSFGRSNKQFTAGYD